MASRVGRDKQAAFTRKALKQIGKKMVRILQDPLFYGAETEWQRFFYTWLKGLFIFHIFLGARTTDTKVSLFQKLSAAAAASAVAAGFVAIFAARARFTAGS